MRRLLLLLAVSLSACAQNPAATRTFSLTMATTDAVRIESLTEASIRVMQRRLDRLDQSLKETHSSEGGKVLVTVTTDSPEGINALTEELQAPFTLAFMEETDEAGADITVAGHGSFKATGFTEQDIDWTTAEPQANGKARVQLGFTPAGRAKMEAIYAKNTGKFIGMFVRGRLVSKLLVEKDGLKEKIVIGDIPSLDFAQTFSDDVNVGRYVTFSVSQ